LLREYRGVPIRPPRLTLKPIRAWARAYRERTGKWPTRSSGVIPEAPRETWGKSESALWFGNRGLRGGSSLAKLLGRGKRLEVREAFDLLQEAPGSCPPGLDHPWSRRRKRLLV
jgi:hypothetical protein